MTKEYWFLNSSNSYLLFTAMFCLLIASSCRESAKELKPKVMYKAINKDDTAHMNIMLTERTFEGQFEINYHGLYKDSGDVNGVIKGDTLKGTYHYQHYGTEEFYRIPIALLKRDNKLIMGVGEMEIYMNMTFFKKRYPIDYSKPKFVFEKAGTPN